MAQYMGIVSGGRGEASRLGHKTSGLRTQARGWRSGITVYASYDEEQDRDEFTVYHTGGSGGRAGSGYLFTLRDGMTAKEIAAELRRAARAIAKER